MLLASGFLDNTTRFQGSVVVTCELYSAVAEFGTDRCFMQWLIALAGAVVQARKFSNMIG